MNGPSKMRCLTILLLASLLGSLTARSSVISVGYYQGLSFQFFGNHTYGMDLWGNASGESRGSNYSRLSSGSMSLTAGLRPSRRILRKHPLELRLGLSFSSDFYFRGRDWPCYDWVNLRMGIEPIVVAAVPGVPKLRLGASWSIFSVDYFENYNYGYPEIRRSIHYSADGPSLLGSLFVYWNF